MQKISLVAYADNGDPVIVCSLIWKDSSLFVIDYFIAYWIQQANSMENLCPPPNFYLRC